MDVTGFITKWLGVRGGAERANYGQFVNNLCGALDLPVPGVATSGSLSDYQFERPGAGRAIVAHARAMPCRLPAPSVSAARCHLPACREDLGA